MKTYSSYAEALKSRDVSHIEAVSNTEYRSYERAEELPAHCRVPRAVEVEPERAP